MTNRQRAIFMAWITPMIFFLIIPFSVIDLLGWIAHGRYLLEHHQLLRNDIFSVFPTKPLVYPSWGISVIYAWIYQWGGLTTVCVMHLAVLAAILQVVYSHSISTLSNPANRIARWSTYIFWIVGAALFDTRPNMISLLPFAMAYVLISKIKKLSDLRPKLIFQLCLINIFWVNVHGSFVLLEAMLGWKLFFLFIDSLNNADEEKNRIVQAIRPLFSMAIVGMTSLINPFTYQVFPYVLETVEISKRRVISEWAPTAPWGTFPIGLLYFLLLATVIVLIFKYRNKESFWKFLSSPFLLVTFNGLTAIRNAALPFIVLLPALKEAGLLDREDQSVSYSKDSELPKFSNIFKVAPFILLLILSFPSIKAKALFFLPADKKATFDDSALFETAAKIRASGKTCPIFNDWKVGSFLMLNLPNKIFLDFRNIIYSDEDFDTYLSALKAGPHWEDLLNRYQACFAVVDKKYSKDLVTALQGDKAWRRIGDESGYAAFERL
jgi:hypothetical protein